MFTESAGVYDLIYASLKDYVAETRQIANLIRMRQPRAQRLLDVACGTGEHTRLLAAEGFAVDGVDVEPAFTRIAQAKHPRGAFFTADMSDFHLAGRYDAVLCLFSSIGYLRTLDRVESALACFREHLADGGIIVVEPWLQPGVIEEGREFRHAGEGGGVHVERIGRSRVEGRLSRLFFDYTITDARGTRHVSEVHELGLFTPAEMMQAFRNAGLDAEYDAEGLTGRGLYMAHSR